MSNGPSTATFRLAKVITTTRQDIIVVRSEGRGQRFESSWVRHLNH
jgi:hypothetical protein